MMVGGKMPLRPVCNIRKRRVLFDRHLTFSLHSKVLAMIAKPAARHTVAMSTSVRNRSIFKPQNTDASSSVASATLRAASLARRKKEEKLAAQKQSLVGSENVSPLVAPVAISCKSNETTVVASAVADHNPTADVQEHVPESATNITCVETEAPSHATNLTCVETEVPSHTTNLTCAEIEALSNQHAAVVANAAQDSSSFSELPRMVSSGVDAWVSTRVGAVVHGVASAFDSARAFITGESTGSRIGGTPVRQSTSPIIAISSEAQAEIAACSSSQREDGTVVVDLRKRRRTFVVDSQPFASFKSPEDKAKSRSDIVKVKEELDLATEKFLEEERNHEATCAKLSIAEENVSRLKQELLQAEEAASITRREKEELDVVLRSHAAEIQTLNQQVAELNEQVAMLPVMEQELAKTNEILAIERKKRKDDQEEIAQVHSLRRQVAELQTTLLCDSDIRRKLHNQLQELRGNVRVMVRIRPALEKEGASESKILLGKNSATGTSKSAVKIAKLQDDPKGKESPFYTFDFDRVFSKEEDQASVFAEISKLVQSALDGYKVCIFAYGQTGSGKTHTMMGSEGGVGCDGDTSGVIPRAIRQVFASCSALETQGWSFSLVACFLEIYNDGLRDLLATNPSSKSKKEGSSKDEEKLDIHHDNGDTVVKNLTYVTVSSAEQLLDLVKRSVSGRTVAATVRNDTSSRSHSIFQLKITARHAGRPATECTAAVPPQSLMGVLNMIDLAGSESLTSSDPVRIAETQHINKSLGSIADVIGAISSKQNHIPFRNSKLTYFLQSSLGGQGKCLMFANVSPGADQYQETVNTLRFASKVSTCAIGAAQKRVVAE